jgi:hypothetical protein
MRRAQVRFASPCRFALRPLLATAAVGVGALLPASCKTLETEGSSETLESHMLPQLASYPRYVRNKDRPWVGWQWLPGARNDPAEAYYLRIAGFVYGGAALEESRITLVANNLNDSNGLADSMGRARAGDPHPLWVELYEGEICEDPQPGSPAPRCEPVDGCGPANDWTNAKWRARTLHGECNDFDNPMMGSVGQRMARNSAYNSAYNSVTDKHFAAVNAALKDFGKGNGSGPDPAEVSRAFMRRESKDNFHPAPHFNLWAAAWIQFMTHDWFSHANEGYNDTDAKNALGLKSGAKVAATIADDGQGLPPGFDPKRAPSRTFRNHVTHWWDASQLYGWDKVSQGRVRDGAYLRLGKDGLLPPLHVDKYGVDQEAAAFVDNWWIGLSLLHDLFSRHHNWIVDELKSGKHGGPPGQKPGTPWSDDLLFDTARLIVSATIAKIHTIEWTPQLLYNNVGNLGMQSNWSGFLNFDFHNRDEFMKDVRENYASMAFGKVINALQGKFRCPNKEVSALAAFTGITRLDKQEHFCAPFTLPEEFTSVYRLHAMMPDELNLYDVKTGHFLEKDPASHELATFPVISLARQGAHPALQKYGIDDWVATFGVHPCGQLTANNFPQFLTDLPLVTPPGGTVDMAAMDILRDRERGVPRFNEFRRQIGLKEVRSFDDFIDHELEYEISSKHARDVDGGPELTPAEIDARKAELQHQRDAIAKLAKLYDNDVEAIDLQAGILAEFVHPHGFVISETQFQIFILNASRRIFSDRFLTEAFNEKYYTQWGLDLVNNVTLMKLIRQHFPAVAAMPAAQKATNAFDIWDRDREGFSLCPTSAEWFKSHPATSAAYKNLLCHPQGAPR